MSEICIVELQGAPSNWILHASISLDPFIQAKSGINDFI